jgi:hypothetical protein
MAWLPATSTTVEPARLDMARCDGGGIILSSVATRYQLGLTRQAGLVIDSPPAPTPQGTCESAMNAANSGLRSAPNDAGNFSRSWNTKPSFGGWIECDGLALSVFTDSPSSGANAAMYTSAPLSGPCRPR